MKKYWVKVGMFAIVIVTTMTLSHGETIYHNGVKAVVIDAM